MLDNKKTLKDYKVEEGDMVMMDRIRAGPNAAAGLAAAARSAGFQAPPSRPGGGGQGGSGARGLDQAGMKTTQPSYWRCFAPIQT